MFRMDDTHICVQNINTRRYSKMRAVDFRPYHRHSDPCTTFNAFFKAQDSTRRTPQAKPVSPKKPYTRKERSRQFRKHQRHHCASHIIATGKSVSRPQQMGRGPRRKCSTNSTLCTPSTGKIRRPTTKGENYFPPPWHTGTSTTRTKIQSRAKQGARSAVTACHPTSIMT